MDAYEAEDVLAQAERHLVAGQFPHAETLAGTLLERAARARKDGSGVASQPTLTLDAGYVLLQAMQFTGRCVCVHAHSQCWVYRPSRTKLRQRRGLKESTGEPPHARHSAERQVTATSSHSVGAVGRLQFSPSTERFGWMCAG
jgi:hypothetical protein